MQQVQLLNKEEIRPKKRCLKCGEWKDFDYINAKIALFSQSDKRQKTLIQLLALMGKYKNGNTILKKMYAMNLITEYEAISMAPIDFEKELVICPIGDKEITRAECLDYSGSHYEECRGCEIGLSTKKWLAPPIQEHV